MALSYTKEERAILRDGSQEEKEAVKNARINRAKAFIITLSVGDFYKILKAIPQGERGLTVPKGTAQNVNDYVITKDILTKAVFGEPGRDGKTLSLVRSNPGALTLWTRGTGKNKKDVAVYTRLDFDREAMKAAGLTVGRNLSKCAREVFGAMLSEALAAKAFPFETFYFYSYGRRAPAARPLSPAAPLSSQTRSPREDSPFL